MTLAGLAAVAVLWVQSISVVGLGLGGEGDAGGEGAGSGVTRSGLLCEGSSWHWVRTEGEDGSHHVYFWDRHRGVTRWSPPSAAESGCPRPAVASAFSHTISRPATGDQENASLTAIGRGDHVVPARVAEDVEAALREGYERGLFDTPQSMRDCASLDDLVASLCVGGGPCPVERLRSAILDGLRKLVRRERGGADVWAEAARAVASGGARLDAADARTAFVMATRYPGRGEEYPWHNDAQVDRRRGNTPRAVTAIYYAAAWEAAGGGALQVRGAAPGEAAAGGPEVFGDACPAATCMDGPAGARVLPLPNRLVVLDSALMHRVAPVRAPRYAVVAWLYAPGAGVAG